MKYLGGYAIFKTVKRYLPKFIKVQVLTMLRGISDMKLSFTSEIPVLFGRNRHEAPKGDTSKVYDCFYFFDELEILELRLNILNEYVDFFVICEASVTFSGKAKSFTFLDNYERFRKFHDKIIFVPLNWSPTSRDEMRRVLHSEVSLLEKVIAKRTLQSGNIPPGEENNHWITEFFQKESMHLALKECNQNDLVYISDVDEIWNPLRKFYLNPNRIYIFKQTPYIYFLNNRSNEHWHSWTGSVVSSYGNIRDKSINEIRTHGKLKRYVVLNGGWHFSFQGGVSRILHKLDSYGHQEFNVPEVLANIPNFISLNQDLQGRAVKYKKRNRGLPKYLLKNKDLYRHMML